MVYVMDVDVKSKEQFYAAMRSYLNREKPSSAIVQMALESLSRPYFGIEWINKNKESKPENDHGFEVGVWQLESGKWVSRYGPYFTHILDTREDAKLLVEVCALCQIQSSAAN